MAVLSETDRVEVWEEYMRDRSSARDAVLIVKVPLAAVNAIDDWLNANAAALNSAIPQPGTRRIDDAAKSAGS